MDGPTSATDNKLSFATLDVFTNTRYLGNPLAVVTLPPDLHDLPKEVKQRIAREFNLSETVFLHQPADTSASSRSVDIFTTTKELPFAGHPTIGTASFLLREAGLTHVRTLVTKSGSIDISPTAADSVRAVIPHDVHLHSRQLSDLPVANELMKPGTVGVYDVEGQPASIVKGMTFVLVELPDLYQLSRVGARRKLDLAELDGLLDEGPWKESFIARYYYVMMRDGTIRTRNVELDFEDPATGSAACTLAAYLTLRKHSAKEGSSIRYNIVQGVEMGRRSDISVDVIPETNSQGRIVAIKEMFLGGSAVLVTRGTISL